VPDPVVAAIYELDGLTRRSPSLQMTADGRGALRGSADPESLRHATLDEVSA
jgi:NADH-quinone oxidoreductase subunit G